DLDATGPTEQNGPHHLANILGRIDDFAIEQAQFDALIAEILSGLNSLLDGPARTAQRAKCEFQWMLTFLAMLTFIDPLREYGRQGATKGKRYRFLMLKDYHAICEKSKHSR